MNLYSLISLFSFLFRNFILPNPFEVLGEEIIINIFKNEVCLTPDSLNLLVGPIYASFTFLIVGLYYIKGSNYILGSFLYLIFYCIHCEFIYVLSYFHFAPIATIIAIVLYVIMHISIFKIRNAVYDLHLIR